MARVYRPSSAGGSTEMLGRGGAGCTHAWSLDLNQPRPNVLYVSCAHCGMSRIIERGGGA